MGGETTAAERADSGGYKPWWAVDKEAWREKFSILSKINSIKKDQDHPLPRWTKADIEIFSQENPEAGAQVKALQRGAAIAGYGGLAGGLGTALFSYRFSKSVGGAALVFIIGTATSWAVSEEVASMGLGLYKFDAMDANLKFLEWWKARQAT